ncbi:hypothetical protein BD413DRAFT_282086 [Trametes elegans]|nr:hypothetical protein BD413DRAFT_282086 [Trametes elegans]
MSECRDRAAVDQAYLIRLCGVAPHQLNAEAGGDTDEPRVQPLALRNFGTVRMGVTAAYGPDDNPAPGSRPHRRRGWAVATGSSQAFGAQGSRVIRIILRQVSPLAPRRRVDCPRSAWSAQHERTFLADCARPPEPIQSWGVVAYRLPLAGWARYDRVDRLVRSHCGI